MKVTRKKAAAVEASIRRAFKVHILEGDKGPSLIERDDAWEVVWEEGPYDWAIVYSGGGGSDEDAYQLLRDAGMSAEFASKAAVIVVKPVAGVYCEPINGYVLGLYPA